MVEWLRKEEQRQLSYEFHTLVAGRPGKHARCDFVEQVGVHGRILVLGLDFSELIILLVSHSGSARYQVDVTMRFYIGSGHVVLQLKRIRANAIPRLLVLLQHSLVADAS